MAHRDTLKSTDLSEHDHEEGGGEKASHSEPILTGAAHGEVVPVGLQAGHGQLWVRWTLPARVLRMCAHCQAIVQLLLFLRQGFM